MATPTLMSIRLSETTPGGVTTYTYDIANRLLSSDGFQYITYTYDNNGNLLSDGTRTYTYTSANRVSSIAQGGSSYSFVYNGLGDRLQQTVDAATT
ncbi:MAG: hypothetical protein OEZ02_15630, partial [Anaerolineae bacterium]|nr:hypothetical protein [Anaerolineae bacterium]